MLHDNFPTIGKLIYLLKVCCQQEMHGEGNATITGHSHYFLDYFKMADIWKCLFQWYNKSVVKGQYHCKIIAALHICAIEST